MSLNVQSYLQGAYPPPLRKPEQPRMFLLHWNNSKLKSRRRDETWHEAYGTRYPNGRVTLDFGPPYENMSEMETMMQQAGQYRIEWLDEKQEKQHD